MLLIKYMKNFSYIQSKSKYIKIYVLLVVVRILLVFLPQTGYIHPDEFFQTVEVMAGDEYQLEHTRTWEFNVTRPIRSIAVPYIVYKVPFNLYRIMAMYARYLFGWNILTPYTLLILPRIIMCAISFVNDWSLYKICNLYGLRYDIRLLALASSFVTIVIGTRTFSNSIEMALCSFLLYIVAEAMVHSNSVIFQSEYLNEKYNKAQTTAEKVQWYKMKALLPSHTVHRCIIVANIFVIGCFNRPTFILFAMPIVFFWLLRGLGSKVVSFAHFNIRFGSLVISGIPVFLLFVFIDSLYYGYLTSSEIEFLDVNITYFTVTPLNFIRYNLNSTNTAAHGIHPWYLHLLVNVPLLYNVLGIIAIGSMVHMIYRFCRAEYKYLPRAQSIVALMNATIFTPVVIFSLINHQEARFLVPITLPVVLLHAPKLLTGFATTYPFQRDNKLLQFIYHNVLSTKASADRLRKYWYAVNIALVIFFGFVHQGGVTQLSQYLAENTINYRTHFQRSSTQPNIHLITSHLYNIPTSLLFQPSTKILLTNPDNGQKFTRKKRFFMHEYGSLPLDSLQQRIKSHLDSYEMRLHRDKERYEMYLAIPSSLTEELNIASFKCNHTMIKYRRVKVFYPHLSTEAFRFPFVTYSTRIQADVLDLDQSYYFENEPHAHDPFSVNGIYKQFSVMIHQFGLVLYRIEFTSKNTFYE